MRCRLFPSIHRIQRHRNHFPQKLYRGGLFGDISTEIAQKRGVFLSNRFPNASGCVNSLRHTEHLTFQEQSRAYWSRRRRSPSGRWMLHWRTWRAADFLDLLELFYTLPATNILLNPLKYSHGIFRIVNQAEFAQEFAKF